MSEEIGQEKAQEYMQVAALVCLDLDILKDIAEAGGMSATELVQQIQHAHEQKEALIRDPAARQMRYESASLLFHAAAAGAIRSAPLTEGE